MYLVFGGDEYYPAGGFYDYIGSGVTIDDALAAVNDESDRLHAEIGYGLEWWHVVDVATMKIVASSGDNIMLGHV